MFILLEYAERWYFIRRKKSIFARFRLRFSHFLWCHMDNVIIYIWCEPWKRFRLYGKPKKCNSCSDSFPAAVYTVEFNVVKNVQCKYISPVFLVTLKCAPFLVLLNWWAWLIQPKIVGLFITWNNDSIKKIVCWMVQVNK